MDIRNVDVGKIARTAMEGLEKTANKASELVKAKQQSIMNAVKNDPVFNKASENVNKFSENVSTAIRNAWNKGSSEVKSVVSGVPMKKAESAAQCQVMQKAFTPDDQRMVNELNKRPLGLFTNGKVTENSSNLKGVYDQAKSDSRDFELLQSKLNGLLAQDKTTPEEDKLMGEIGKSLMLVGRQSPGVDGQLNLGLMRTIANDLRK